MYNFADSEEEKTSVKIDEYPAASINKMNQKTFRPSEFSNQNSSAKKNKVENSPRTKSKTRNYSMLTNNYVDTINGAVLTTLSARCKV